MFVQWERPRRWAVRLYKPYKNRTGGYHSSIGVLALSVDRAIEAAQALEPESRIESVNDTGSVDIVVDAPLTPNG
jgi:hypothetical protein